MTTIRGATTTMILAACAACASADPETAATTIKAPVKATADASPEPVATTPPATPTPKPEPEPISLTFAPVLEGDCPGLGVSLVGNEPFIHASPGPLVAHVLPDGTTEDLPVDTMAIGGEPYYVQMGSIEAIEGEWPGDLWLRYLQVDGRVWEGTRYLRRKDGGWWPLARRDAEERSSGVERLYRWTGGNWLGRMNCRDWNDGCKDLGLLLNVIRGPGQAPKFPELRGKVDGCSTHYALTVLPDGAIAAVGRFCHERAQAEEGGAYYAVRWSEPGGTKIDRLPIKLGRAREPGPLLASADGHLYAAVLPDITNEPTTLLKFDGAAWTTLPPLKPKFAGMDLDRDGSLWVIAGGELSRHTGAAWEPQAFLTGPARTIGGLRDPVGWVTQVDGTLWLRTDGPGFTRAELPPPAFSATGKYSAESVASAGRDVWITATYREQGPGWAKTEQRRALLRNSPARPPQRCAQDAQNRPTKGSYAWPPAARDDCTTPYAILIRASMSTPKAFAYPALGKALKGQQGFAAAKFAEIEIGGQRLVGAAVASVAEGRALVERVATKVARSRPELVCATPTELRPLPYDLATGKLAP